MKYACSFSGCNHVADSHAIYPRGMTEIVTYDVSGLPNISWQCTEHLKYEDDDMIECHIEDGSEISTNF